MPTIKLKQFNFEITTISPDSDWGRCITDFIAHIYSKSNSPHSQDHYRSGLEHFFTRFPRKQPHEYTKAEVIAWMVNTTYANGREGLQASAALQSNRLVQLAGLYRYAQSYGVQGEDGHLYPLMRYLPPTAGIHHPKRPDGGNKALSDEELKKFFSAIPRDTLLGKRDFALMSFYFWGARRASEIRMLQWKDIQQQTVIMDGAVSRVAWVYRFFGKGHKSVADFAEVPPAAASALFAYLEDSGIMKTIQPDDYLFTCVPEYIGKRSQDPNAPICAQTVQQLIKHYAQRAGLRRVTCHMFRHTSARARYSAGASLLEIKNLLRHKNLATTSIYLDQMVTTADPTAALLNAKFGNL